MPAAMSRYRRKLRPRCAGARDIVAKTAIAIRADLCLMAHSSRNNHSRI